MNNYLHSSCEPIEGALSTRGFAVISWIYALFMGTFDVYFGSVESLMPLGGIMFDKRQVFEYPGRRLPSYLPIVGPNDA